MNDSAVINMILILAVVLGIVAWLTLRIVIKRLFPNNYLPKNSQNFLYYKIDLLQRKMTTIESHELKKDASTLFDQDYELIRLGKLKAFLNHTTKLPEKSFLVVLNNAFPYVFTKALPALKNKEINLILFIPALIVATDEKYQDIRMQLLNLFQ